MLEEIRARTTEFPDLVVSIQFDQEGIDIDVHQEGSYVGDGERIPWEQLPSYRNPDISLDEIVRMAMYRFLHDSGALKRGDIYGE